MTDEEEDERPDGADFIDNDIKTSGNTEAALAKLVKISQGRRIKMQGPATNANPQGKTMWKTPSVSEQLKASEIIIKVYGEALSDERAAEIIRGRANTNKAAFPDGPDGPVSVRHLARALNAVVGETVRAERGDVSGKDLTVRQKQALWDKRKKSDGGA